MTIINDNTVVVYNFTELKQCLQESNSYNYIYLGSNITLTSGITISSTKANVTIDGTYENTTYTYEDMKSLGTGDTISVRSPNITKVTVKNINVIGNNYYGIIYVPNDNTLKNVIIEYNNLTYTGPQITYHPTGLSRYVDCNIKITASYTSAQEVAECNRIEISGTTSIIHESTSDSTFWFQGQNSQYFKILENANVTIQSLNRELFYGTNNLEFTIQANAKLNLTTALGMGYGTYSTSTVLIDKNAYFKLTQTKQNGSYPTWYCTGSFTMNENSTLIMLIDYPNINNSNYNIYFKTTASSLILNNPKELVLYNSKTNVLYSEQNINFNLTYSRINTWSNSSSITTAGSLDDMPTYSWYKSLSESNLTGTFSSKQTTVSTNNYTEEELATLPSLTNFKLNESKALSIGSMPMTLHPVTDETTIISGYTTPSSDIKISYLNNSQIITANDTTGYFELNIADKLPIGTQITYLANVKNSFIYQIKEIEIIYAGELVLNNAPENIEFDLNPFSTNPILCPSKEKISLTITDTRIESSNWKLYANIDHDLESSTGYTLTDSLVFIDDDSKITPLSQDKILVYTGENNNSLPKTTIITWDYDKGIILRLINEPLENKTKYSSTITWTLEE